MGRLQKGRIFERSGAFYVQYRVTEIVNGKPKRVQRSHRLCDKNDKYYSKNAKSVKLLRDKFMLTINTEQANRSSMVRQDRSIAVFWKDKFLPYCQEIVHVGDRAGQPRRKRSTMKGYKQVWRQHLGSHFGDMTLQEYNNPQFGNQFLRSLTSTQNRTTLKHIKALGTAIFGHAVAEGFLTTNIWREISVPKDAIPPKPTGHYTLAEAHALISALADHVACQLILALSCFLGIRPNEIAALRWEDFDFIRGYVYICRGVVLGSVDTPKTPESVAEIPLIEPVPTPLKRWHDECGSPTSGYVFVSRKGTPINLGNVLSRIIRPHIIGGRRCEACKTVPPKAVGVEWKGLYSGRRGACTNTIEANEGNYAVAQALMRHKSMTTTLNVYKKQITPDAFSQGMKRLEARALEAAAANSTKKS